MKYTASINSLFLVFLIGAAMPVCADTNDCASPPGPHGTIRCESDQIAICEATGTSVNGQCLDKRGKSGYELYARILSAILDEKITADDASRRYSEVLRDRKVKRQNGAVVTFSFSGEGLSGGDGPKTSPGYGGKNSITCKACVTIRSERTCESATGGTKDAAGKLAAEKLHRRLGGSSFMTAADRDIIDNPVVECE